MLETEFIEMEGGSLEVVNLVVSVDPEVVLGDHTYTSTKKVKKVIKPKTKDALNQKLIKMIEGKHIVNLKALYGCNVCNFTTFSKESIDFHSLSHKPTKKPVQKKREACHKPGNTCCTSCFVKKIKKLPDGRLRCPHCSFFTTRLQGLNVHLRSHEKRPYKCADCPYSGRDVKALIQHVRLGHRATQYLDRFEQEVRVKNGKKPYCCKYCEYTTKFAKNLVKHVKKHLDVKPDIELSLYNKIK
ncbi:RE1-silencing transcription factor-like [Pectinophora gossypiella]|uniref:C2H2-type domain-containing protein n=1 Tax=Pectinophora gossypiella TaxID=13191 RepID=A0A1E1WV89_PECGO|nr:RE1-silencing transcription factor-like [Pectinophora gossypiella]